MVAKLGDERVAMAEIDLAHRLRTIREGYENASRASRKIGKTTMPYDRPESKLKRAVYKLVIQIAEEQGAPSLTALQDAALASFERGAQPPENAFWWALKALGLSV